MRPNGGVVEGSLVAAFEAELSERLGGDRTVVALPAAVPALTSALTALGIGPGDEVVVAAYGPAATADAVRLAGAVPAFADIDPRTFCLAPEAVQHALTPRTAAVVAAHRFGHPAGVAQLAAVARRAGLALVEDVTEALEARVGERPAGSFGTVTVHRSAVASSDAAVLRALRGRRGPGFPGTPETVGEARAELAGTEGAAARRRAHARVLDAALSGVLVPYTEPGVRHVYQRYVVRIPGNGRPDRDVFAKALAARGVAATVPVTVPVHRLPAHRGSRNAELPGTERAVADALALPLDPSQTVRDVERIVAACNALGGPL
ncbi:MULTISPECIES: DegT/DnrJ/EryC1/StrS family aminotransferase [Streptomycetaceae]|uniref:Glutamine--scyllo-inositol transaminase n=1 Tax=Streptantibioticus cattleyicolor (strain ATCC 35852 / DSM 46488 / JCM 4925 / NBRC 14057 / NRRL 8057) TaxID=1003195 RepID=F8JUQ5_STREN|nr:DegT/DnrJ/EryC1/StrS family aminotransferase [Streptantibioticus cattleyicolor]AEW96884.1 Glutamine--scyllo-inositol transaminase [Streptantibioticus cattleyicolor NRRL 8057 = DSM 46488]MYS61362.1 aspartate aminotransferase [Streptomyces sp. SID5468]CCB77213.1 putative aspartate aminotransferase [Streptantibioticus cattleyicolor NRRL 8057 = DSM 46488]